MSAAWDTPSIPTTGLGETSRRGGRAGLRIGWRVSRRVGHGVRSGARNGRRKLAEVGGRDRRISTGVGRLPYSVADPALTALSHAADHSTLWFTAATVLTASGGRLRRGALRGVLAIGGSSLLANAVLKPLVPRRRPAVELLPAYRTLTDPPTSSSFPSGHAASAMAFATAVTMESPRQGMWLLPLAATVAYSRVHVGVHWTSDVLAGAALGAGVALATQRWIPVRPGDEAIARPFADAPRLLDGEGLAVVVNARSGKPGSDPYDELVAELPKARVSRLADGEDLGAALDAAGQEDGVVALGIAGGDGSVATAARVAEDLDLPLAVVPTGTLNHFGRDVGVYDVQEVVDATGAGEAVAVDIGEIRAYADGAGRSEPQRVVFVNTASIGGYPEMVRLRDEWQGRLGKWPAAVRALLTTLARARPIRVRIDGRDTKVWMLFIGNGPYAPAGMVPAYRPRLDTGVLQLRYLRADRPFSRARAVLGLLTGALLHSHTYVETAVRTLDLELLDGSQELAADGEVVLEARRIRFSVAKHPVPVYRRDEARWPQRAAGR